MKTRFDHEPTETHGETTSSTLEIKWLEGVGTIEAGELMIPMILDGDAAKKFAALFAIIEDLSFAKEVFVEAEKDGKPKYSDYLTRALIFSGVIAYGRCFGQGVREIRLRADEISRNLTSFSTELHQYIIDLRDKHVAHSVNSLETYTPVAILVRDVEGEFRNGYGVGVVTNRAIGLSRRILLEAIDHIENLINFVRSRVDIEKNDIHAEFVADQKKGKEFKTAPIAQSFDRSDIGKRR